MNGSKKGLIDMTNEERELLIKNGVENLKELIEKKMKGRKELEKRVNHRINHGERTT